MKKLKTCSECGQKTSHLRNEQYATEIKHDGKAYLVTVEDVPVYRCSECGALAITDAADEAVSRELRRVAGLMTPEEIREGRRSLGMTQKQLLQKEFVPLIRVVSQRYDALKADLNAWRKRVACGEIDFDPAWEDEFKGALRALVALGKLLFEKYDAYRSRGLILAKPGLVGLVQAYLREAQKSLDTWESPEWETADERSVQWNKEQTSYLRERLGTPA